jgi:hypothetical protein
MNSSITKLREILKLLKYSPKLQSLFKRECQDENEFCAIELGVRSIWNSLYDTLTYALKFKQGFEAFISKFTMKRYPHEIRTCSKNSSFSRELKPTTQEWDIIEITCGILSFFKEMKISFSANARNTEGVLEKFYVIADFFCYYT